MVERARTHVGNLAHGLKTPLAVLTNEASRSEGGLAALMEDRRTDKAVSEVLGAEQIGKSGDSDAAQALKRVTGLTVVGGKYIYVRGMGERYSSTLLNGQAIPSPEPERRVIPLDLFATEVLESLYQLTAAEAELVRLLSQGFSLDEAARERGVTINTARSQLKQVFSKTDTRRQGELMRLVLTGVASIRDSEPVAALPRKGSGSSG